MPTIDGVELSWFDAGSAIFDGVTEDPSCYPPLGDREAQRAWLAGFGGAWCELAEAPPLDSGHDPRDGPVVEVLSRALAERPELLRQMLSISRVGAEYLFEA